jgi:hypothetical protein
MAVVFNIIYHHPTANLRTDWKILAPYNNSTRASFEVDVCAGARTREFAGLSLDASGWSAKQGH